MVLAGETTREQQLQFELLEALRDIADSMSRETQVITKAPNVTVAPANVNVAPPAVNVEVEHKCPPPSYRFKIHRDEYGNIDEVIARPM